MITNFSLKKVLFTMILLLFPMQMEAAPNEDDAVDVHFVLPINWVSIPHYSLSDSKTVEKIEQFFSKSTQTTSE